MGKASRTKVESTRREKIAAQRAAERRSEQRRRILLASGSVVVVLAIVLVLVIVKLNDKPSANSAAGLSNGPTGTALSAAGGQGHLGARQRPEHGRGGRRRGHRQAHPISGPALTSNGKPEMLVHRRRVLPVLRGRALGDDRGAEPVRHVHRPGHRALRRRQRAGSGALPEHADLDVLHATYSSPYLTFTPVEIQTNIPDTANGTYTTLQTPTAAQQALVTKYDAADSSGACRSRSSTSATST